MAFIDLADAADRLGVSLSYLRDLIDRTDRKETVLDLDLAAAANEINRLWEEVRLPSLSLCKECGRNGQFRYSYSRSLTLCDKHARLAAPVLPGDGVMADPASDGVSISELPHD